MADVADRFAEALHRARSALAEDRPLTVALDGGSGSGKSTLAAAVAQPGWLVVIEGDDFYAGGSAATWDRRSAAEKVANGLDWRRQYPVLEAIRQGRRARWQPFDWSADDWDADEARLADTWLGCDPAPVVLLEGAYSARPELAPVLDLRVLLDTPPGVRKQRVVSRDGQDYAEDWFGRWDEAERHYFGTVMPPDAFDLVLSSC
jgi:uridine kinase